jgi:signal transduction histidine kinase
MMNTKTTTGVLEQDPTDTCAATDCSAPDRGLECDQVRDVQGGIEQYIRKQPLATFPPDGEPAVIALERAENRFRDANRRTDEFLATLGHEMRNPLGALSNALQIWPMAQHDPARMEELRGIMQRQVRQLTRLGDDLLDTARIAQGTLALRREEIELSELLDAACEEVRPFIDRCGHVLTVARPVQPLVVQGDKSRLVQVFANLIQNAAKFTEQKGRLSVTIESQSGMALVWVRDNGRGIDGAMLPVIFAPFTQVDKPRTPGNDGLGIGLRLVKTIVELHGGAVTAHSEGLGRGSEFTVHLPLWSDAAITMRLPRKPPRQAVPDDGRRPPAHHIMVVDDDRSSAFLLAEMLRSLGQAVEIADDGAAAVRTVLDNRPQVVFLDIVMRGMDGY